MLLPVALAVLLMGSIPAAPQPTPVSVDDAPTPAESYTLSGGIGAMSTAGTSRLLKDYDEPMRSEILDYLFKPNWGASMHHLKVALGGDGETTCGSEPTTMRNATAENYLVGYEMWLMSEAKKRNPDILLYGLPLSFPAWVGNGTASPYSDVQATASYVRKWCAGAKAVWNLTIDYIGLWNERPTTKAYVMELRKQLDAHSLHNVKIVGNDAKWDPIAQEVLSDAELRSAVSVLSAHYPGTKSSPNAQKALKEYGIPLWNVEEYSTFSDETGALCWIRCVVDDYVNGFMTMTSSWHLIGAFYPGIAFWNQGMLTAVEPWSGNFHVNPQVWATAHFTQFTSVGDRYLAHGSGSGKLASGGSYVSLVDGKGGLTVLVQKASHENSRCIRPALASYTTVDEDVVITLGGGLAHIKSLSCWMSHFPLNGTAPTIFARMPDIVISNGQIKLHVLKDAIYTLSNRGAAAQKGQTPPSPPSAPFPLPYSDNFEGYITPAEARYFSDFSGAWEVHGGKMVQMTPHVPIGWMKDLYPVSVIGSIQFEDIAASADLEFSAGATAPEFGCLGVRVSNRGNFGLMTRPDGLFLCVQVNGTRATYVITSKFVSVEATAGGAGVLESGVLSGPAPRAVTLNLTVVGQTLEAGVATGGDVLLRLTVPIPAEEQAVETRTYWSANTNALDALAFVPPQSGWVAIASSWNQLRFDNFFLSEPPNGRRTRCDSSSLGKMEGASPVIVACGAAEAISGMRWDLVPGSAGTTVKLRNTSLCLEAVSPTGPPPPPPPPPSPLPPVPPGGATWSQHAAEIVLSAGDRVATWTACDKIVLLTNASASADGNAWHSTVYQSDGWVDIGFCSPDISLEGPAWAGFQTGKAWLYRSAGAGSSGSPYHGGLFKAAKNDNLQGTPYGRKYGRGDNISAIRYNATTLEFAVNGQSQGIITLDNKDPAMPFNAVGCASMCRRTNEAPAILSLLPGPVPPPAPPPPPLIPKAVRLAQCISSSTGTGIATSTSKNGSAFAKNLQTFVYDQESRTIRNEQLGGCLMLPETGANTLPDPTAFTAVVLGDCPAQITAAAPSSTEAANAGHRDEARASAGLQSGDTDSSDTNMFTWSPELGVLRSIYASSNLCVGVCGK